MSNTTEPFIPGFDTCSAGVSELCPVEATLFGDYLNTGASAFYAASYGVLLAAQAYLSWRSKTWTFSAWFAVGCVIEMVGWIGRILLSKNPWSFGGFVIQNITLVMGPTFVAAAISITFKHLVLWYGPEFSLLRPALLPWVLVGTDCISIGIQGAGGAISSSASGSEDTSMMDMGSNLLVAGVAFQVANMVICGAIMLVYVYRRWLSRKSGITNSSPSADATPASRKKVTIYVWALVAAYIAIITRCIYRIPEMASGWGSELQKNETTFLVLDGAMVLGACIILTVFHAHFFFPYLSKAKREGEKAAAEGSEVELRADGYAKCR